MRRKETELCFKLFVEYIRSSQNLTERIMFLYGSIILTLFGYAFAQSGPFEGFNCDKYSHVLMGCRIYESFGIAFYGQDDGVTTGTDLLEEISAKCSNLSFLDPYYKCLSDIVELCPNKTTEVMEAAGEKLSFFCEGTHASAFINTVLQAGYSYNVQCEVVLSPEVNECALRLLLSGNIVEDLTLTSASKMISVMFTCLNERFLNMSPGTLPCGSSREEIVLRFWIQVLSDAPLGYSLSESQRNELQKLVMKSKHSTNLVDIIQASLRSTAEDRRNGYK